MSRFYAICGHGGTAMEAKPETWSELGREQMVVLLEFFSAIYAGFRAQMMGLDAKDPITVSATILTTRERAAGIGPLIQELIEEWRSAFNFHLQREAGVIIGANVSTLISDPKPVPDSAKVNLKILTHWAEKDGVSVDVRMTVRAVVDEAKYRESMEAIRAMKAARQGSDHPESQRRRPG